MLKISSMVSIPDSEIEMSAMRSQGAGGQNVNKVETAVHLRFDIAASSLPDYYKRRLLKLRDKRSDQRWRDRDQVTAASLSNAQSRRCVSPIAGNGEVGDGAAEKAKANEADKRGKTTTAGREKEAIAA